MGTFHLPTYVEAYERKLKDHGQLKKEIATLKPLVFTWLQTLPRQSFQLHNGKLRLAELKKRASINQAYMERSLVTFLTQTQQMTQENAETFARHAAAYMWQQRPEKVETSLVRTYSQVKQGGEQRSAK